MKLMTVFIMGIVSYSVLASAAVIGLKGGIATDYMVLNLNKEGNVEVAYCPLTNADPVVDCDPNGTSTLVTTRSLFDSKLAVADQYDETILAEKERYQYLKSNQEWHESKLSQIVAEMDATEKRISQISNSQALLTKQIQDVKAKLQDPQIDPQDKKELEAFILKGESDIKKLNSELNSEKSKLATLSVERNSNKSSIDDFKKQILICQDRIQKQKNLIDKKVTELKENLDHGSTAVAYEKESLYFVSFFIFDPKKAVLPETNICRAEASFVDGLGKVRAKLSLSQGIFPKAVVLGDTVIQIYDGAVVDISILQGKKFNWASNGEIFDFQSAYTRKPVTCYARDGISGYENNMIEKEIRGDLIAGSQSCYGEPARMHFSYQIFYVGNFDRQTADTVCKSIEPVKNYSTKGEILNERHSMPGYWESKLNNEVSIAPFLQALQVQAHSDLKDGYYAWGDAKKPLIYQYTPKGATLVNLEGTALEQNMSNWKLPTLCSVRIQQGYCDDGSIGGVRGFIW